MKKLNILFIGIFSMSTIYAQDITDALQFAQSEIQGTARFRALSGAFGALGGDMSAVSANPASSAVFSQSEASFSLSSLNTDNSSQYFNGLSTSNESTFDINQAGVAFVFKTSTSNPWRKFSLGIAYDKTNTYNDNWHAVGTNTNDDGYFSNSIASYFYDYADGLRLDEISAFPDESLSYAYSDIGSAYGFAHQQAFLGFESFILQPDDINDNANTTYFSNVAPGNFDHEYSYTSTGYNGKMSFNFAGQFEDNLYLGLNLNAHFIDYQKTNLLREENNNVGSLVNYIEFENTLATSGRGFSFQLGGIMKLTPEFRVGLTYDSPTWLRINEETTQYIKTIADNGYDNSGTEDRITIDPNIVNIYQPYRLQTPSKTTASLAYVFGNKGLLSFDYSTKNYGGIKFRPVSDWYFSDQNSIMANTLKRAATYRFGGEYKIKQFSLRGGYRYEESPYKNGSTIGNLTGHSLGLGYNFGNTKLDITYDGWNRTDTTPLYNVGLIDTATIDRSNSNVTVSLCFNI